MQIKPPPEQIEIEKAIIMAVDCITKKCRNPKPVLLHSLRVGFKLQELNQPKEVIIAGILHDLIEDTDCKINRIKREFGLKVAKLVSACSQVKGEDYKVRWYKLLNNVKKAGKEAMLIKVVDGDDNLPYTPLVKSPKELKKVLWKHQMVIEKLKSKIGHLKIFKEYHKNYKEMLKKLKKM